MLTQNMLSYVWGAQVISNKQIHKHTYIQLYILVCTCLQEYELIWNNL